MSAIDRSVLRERIEDRREELVDLLSELIARESVTGNEKPAQEVVVSRLESHGLEVDTWEPDADDLRDHPGFFETSSYAEYGYDDRPNVAATCDGAGNGRSLTLSGHVDVVPVDEDEWRYDPWDATVEDGRLYGRGSNDMLGGVATILVAFEALDDLDVELAGDLTIQTTIEEEDGGPGGVLSALERGYRPDAAIITEPSGLPDIGMASGGVMYFRVRVPGKSAHAAQGYAGVNAIGKATTLYRALDELDQERKSRISYEPAVRQNPKLDGHETNLNVGSIDGGDWPSTVPSEAVLEGRIGWPPGETREEVRAEIEAAVRDVAEDDEWLSDHPPALEWFGWNAAPHELDTDAEIVRLARENAETVTGEETTFGGGAAGNDERFYNRYYDIPCPSVGPRGDNIHGADEYVEIDSLVETAQTLALTAVDWCGTVE
ncbi:ArgE/DapE family deacylase [Haloterrigena alkaliphila]|uniref:ArgE/DapE family deacylase n=1 Tax=Haloterrigena alkaliphila TaxID=2816475 RepID=A0A8A2V9D9_9EURY|nr:ArgE/DapE family deacylase [Haloterrigena alkaliphila]QSW98553.1 ArgE/DapE family deacylase [Haloterrigena alkaliphila]